MYPLYKSIKSNYHQIAKNWFRVFLGFFSLTILLGLIAQPMASAMTFNDLQSIVDGTPYYDPYDKCVEVGNGTLNGNVFAFGDSILVNAEQVGKLSKKLKMFGYTDVSIDADGGLAISYPGMTKNTTALQVAKNNKDKIAAAGTVLIVLGTNRDDYDQQIPKLMKVVREANPNNRIFWVNVGTTANIDTMNQSNKAINKHKDTYNYSVIDWQKEVEAKPSLIAGDGVHPSSSGSDRLVSIIVDAFGEFIGDNNGGSDNSSTPYPLPATSGKTGLEERIDSEGRVPSSGQKVSFSKFAKLGQSYRDYYITMRWNYVAWNWNGTTANTDNKQLAWFSAKPRIVLVTNKRTSKSIYAAALESGPAPWTGVDTQPNNNPKQGWKNPQKGTPPQYTGRVSGFPPVAFKTLGAKMGMADGSGDVLTYQWAPNQNVTPGPTDASASANDNECVSETNTGNAQAIVDWALKFAWDNEGHSTSDAKPIYKEYYPKYYGGGNDYSACNQFVAVVMRASGADTKYELSITNTQEGYVQKHPEKYTKVANLKSTKDLQPGDIMFRNVDGVVYKGGAGHTWIYVGDQKGGDKRDAAYHTHAPESGSVMIDGYTTAYRLK